MRYRNSLLNKRPTCGPVQKIINSLLLIYSCLTVVQAASYPLDLGVASQFNGFILGDMDASNSDVEGRLAVGGNLTLNNYSIGMQLDNSWNFKDTLVVGGNIHYRNGRIYHGNARSGGSADIDNTVGFYNKSPSQVNGSYIPGNALDFHAAELDLKQKSTFWGSLTANGNPTFDAYGNLRLQGTNAGLNIFTITAQTLENTTSFWLDIPEKAMALINVSGATAKLTGFGFYRTVNGVKTRIADNKPADAQNPAGFRYDGHLSYQVLLNFVDAHVLDMHAISVKANVLAPLADTTFYNGQVNGNLVVASLKGKVGENSGQINIVTIAEPPVSLLFFGLLPIFWRIKRKNCLKG